MSTRHLIDAAHTRQENQTEIQEIAEAVRDGGHQFQAVAEGLAYLWKRGKLAELGEALIDIKTELIRDAFCKEAAREMFVRLLTKSTIGAPGTMEPDELERLKTTCPELAEIADSWAARRLSKSERDHFGAMWMQSRGKFYQCAFNRLGDWDEAREVVQELAAQMLNPRIYRMMEKSPNREQFERFAFHNLGYCLGTHRKRKRRLRKQFPSVDGRKFDAANAEPIHRSTANKVCRRRPSPIRDSSVLARILRKERNALLWSATGRLTDREAALVQYHICRDESLPTVGERLGLSASTLVKCKADTLAKLREAIPSWMKPERTFDDSVRRLRLQDLSVNIISRRLGCPIPTIVKHIKKMGLETDIRGRVPRKG